MASVTDKLLKVGNPGSATTLSSPGYTVGATSITVGSTSNWPTDTGVVFAIDEAEVVNGVEVQVAGTYNEYVGTVASGTSVTNVAWVLGSGDRNYASGALTRVYIPVSAERENRIVEWGLVHADQDGTLKTSAVQAALNLPSGAQADWTPLATAPSLTASNGQREFQLTYTGVDYTDRLQPGTKLKIPRTVTPTTQCTSLNGTNQYWVDTTPAGMTFTDDFVVSAWVKLSSYPALEGIIASRYNGTNGWEIRVESTGIIRVVGYNGGAGNASWVVSYQSMPLNTWVHISAQLDMSTFTATTTTSYMMLDGVDIPASVARSGTNPTSLINNVGNLEIGSKNGGLQPFPGKIAHVAIYGAKVAQQTIRDTMNKKLAGTETSLVAYFPMDGDGNDLTVNNNVLVGMNSATATSLDNPMNATEYAIVTKVEKPAADTLVTVFCPSGTGLPNQSLGVSSYSTARSPYGFPAEKSKWRVEIISLVSAVQVNNATTQWLNRQLTVPVGGWQLGFSFFSNNVTSTATTHNARYGLSTVKAEAVNLYSQLFAQAVLVVVNDDYLPLIAETDIHLSAQTTYYLNGTAVGTNFNIAFGISPSPGTIYAENAYL